MPLLCRPLPIPLHAPAGSVYHAPMVALLAGATGLVGNHCLSRLLEATRLRGGGSPRRPLPTIDPKLTVELVDFARLEERAPPAAAVALCALAPPSSRPDSQQAFRAVDQDAVVAFARWARPRRVRDLRAGLVGRRRCRSRTFYLRVKGETEEAVAALGFRRFVSLRPSLILGDTDGPSSRRGGGASDDAGAVGAAGRIVAPLSGDRRRTVAAAMIAAAQDERPGRSLGARPDRGCGRSPLIAARVCAGARSPKTFSL